MERTIRFITKALYLLAFAAMLASCYTYKDVFDVRYDSQDGMEATLLDNVEKGDWIMVKINDKSYGGLQVTGIDANSISVMRFLPDGRKNYHILYLSYIQKLEVQVPDPMYTIGAGFSALLMFFYILV